MEEKEKEGESLSDLMRTGRLEQAFALPQQGCSSASSWMLLLVTHVHFNPQVSVVHATPMLLSLFIYMLPEVNTSQALEDTVLYTGEERRGCSPTVLANTGDLCAMVGAFKVLVWFMGRRESQERTFICRTETHPVSGPAAGWATVNKRTALGNMKRPLHFFSLIIL